MSTQETVYQIIGGPNRNDLVNAFLYAYDGDIGKNLCRFMLDKGVQGEQVIMRLVGLTHEDGSGHSFIIRGYFGKDRVLVEGEGYYNARTRKGQLKIINR